MVIALSATYDA